MRRLRTLFHIRIVWQFWVAAIQIQLRIRRTQQNFSSSDTSSPSTTVSAQPVGPWVNVSDASDRPSIVVIPNKQAPTDLAIRDIRVGVGNKVEAGDVVEVHYDGALLADGTEFDASWNRSETFFVPIGVGLSFQVGIKRILGMQEGGQRVLVIPPRLAYGTSGAGGYTSER